MRTTQYSVTKESQGEEYRKLLGLAVRFCEKFSLVLRQMESARGPRVQLQEEGRRVLESLAPSLLSKQEVYSWPGTNLFEPSSPALLYTFRLSLESLEILTTTSKGLYDWQQPRLPEDPCFYLPGGEVWLATIAHEGDAFIRLTDEMKLLIERELPQLELVADIYRDGHWRSALIDEDE